MGTDVRREAPSLGEGMVRLVKLTLLQHHLSQATPTRCNLGAPIAEFYRHLDCLFTIPPGFFKPAKIEAHMAAHREVCENDILQSVRLGDAEATIVGALSGRKSVAGQVGVCQSA